MGWEEAIFREGEGEYAPIKVIKIPTVCSQMQKIILKILSTCFSTKKKKNQKKIRIGGVERGTKITLKI